jgi:hypothetical protein
MNASVVVLDGVRLGLIRRPHGDSRTGSPSASRGLGLGTASALISARRGLALPSPERRRLGRRWIGSAHRAASLPAQRLWQIRHGYPTIEDLRNVKNSGRTSRCPLEFVNRFFLHPLCSRAGSRDSCPLFGRCPFPESSADLPRAAPHDRGQELLPGADLSDARRGHRRPEAGSTAAAGARDARGEGAIAAPVVAASRPFIPAILPFLPPDRLRLSASCCTSQDGGPARRPSRAAVRDSSAGRAVADGEDYHSLPPEESAHQHFASSTARPAR